MIYRKQSGDFHPLCFRIYGDRMSVIKKILFFAFLFLLSFLIIWVFIKEFKPFLDQTDRTPNPNTSSLAPLDSDILSGEVTTTQESVAPTQPTIFLVQGYQYELISVQKTKDFASLPLESFYLPGIDKIDAESSYFHNKTYVAITLTIENTLPSAKKANIGSHCLTLITEHRRIFREICYSSCGNPADMKNYYYCSFQGNEQITITLGYIIEDAIVDEEKLALLLNMEGYDDASEYVEYLYINRGTGK